MTVVTVDHEVCPTCLDAYNDATERWVIRDRKGADRGCYDDEVDALNYALVITECGW